MNVLVIFAAVIFVGKLDASIKANSTREIWRDCSSHSSPVHITRLNMEPNPVLLPGDMFFTIEGYTNRTLGSSALHVDIVREGRWFDIPIPCIGKIGSCTYRDMCTLLEDMVNENWMGFTRTLAQNIIQMLRRNGMTPGLCSQPPQSLSIIRNRINLPRLPAALYWFAEGTYRANVRVTDNISGEELVCFDMRINMKQQEEECSGFWGCLLSL